MLAASETSAPAIRITRADPSLPILATVGRHGLAIRPGTTVEVGGLTHSFADGSSVELGHLEPGEDYGLTLGSGEGPTAVLLDAADIADDIFAGFHFAPGGNAEARAGGDGIPVINPLSLWDRDFRPSCPNPRGMTMVAMPDGRRIWVDIYLLGVEHLSDGTSRCGAVIADGRDLPDHPNGEGKAKKLDYATAVEIYAAHGKRMLGAEEFFAAAYGVRERCSRDNDPKVTGSLGGDGQRFISTRGLFDATGTLWQWGTDGHLTDPRPSIFGGSWFLGSGAGSRFAFLDYWPEISDVDISARGACGHLSPA